MAEEVNPDVLAQMKRIWSALNDGTVNRDEANAALKDLHDVLSGAAYDDVAAEVTEPGPEAEEGGEDDHPARKPRKKK